jgi:hypothetical protein
LADAAAPASLRAAAAIQVGDAGVPLLGRANLWVDAVDASSYRLVQSLMRSAVEGTAPGQLELLVYDERLSGLAAPFWALNSGGDKVLRIFGDEPELKAGLAYLGRHIQGVKNVMQGEAESLVEYRAAVGFPVEGYKLVVLSADFSTLGEDLRTRLGILFKAGPAAGVSFIVHSLSDGVNEFLLSGFTQLNLWKETLEQAGVGDVRGWSPPSAQALVETAQRAAAVMASTKVDPIRFRDIQSVDELWPDSSADGIRFCIGRYGRDTVALTLGDELNQRHNMLVTGAVGQGKSNLISVIVHSLCQRYAPSELELYLLDFKEGVTLQAFFDPATGRFLPHARVLGLEADREFGLSVLRHLHAVYRERMRVFKAAGTQSIDKYRRANPNSPMPRIALVIDEFQMMFADRDKVSDEIADLLVKGVRLFRACGIHVVLASQTIGGNMALMGSAGEGLFGQVPTRVALKNSLAESHATLSAKNDAATHLRVGQAIVNEDYGEPQSNRKTSIALADPADLAAMRELWWRRRPDGVTPPTVFEGSVKRSLADDAGAVAAARARGALRLFLGSRIDVAAKPLDVAFSRDVGRNAALIGSGDALTQLQNMALSLARQTGCQFMVLDLLDSEPAWAAAREDFAALLRAAGSPISFIDKEQVPQCLTEVAASVAARGAGQPPLVVMGLGLDRARSLPPEFQDLARTGPAAGVHLIGWWRKLEAFREHVGYGGEANFDIRLALKLDPASVKQLMGDPLLEWRAQDNRMIAWDVAELPEAITVIPYGRVRADTAQVGAGLP